jgi:hypothetical protein
VSDRRSTLLADVARWPRMRGRAHGKPCNGLPVMRSTSYARARLRLLRATGQRRTTPRRALCADTVVTWAGTRVINVPLAEQANTWLLESLRKAWIAACIPVNRPVRPPAPQRSSTETLADEEQDVREWACSSIATPAPLARLEAQADSGCAALNRDPYRHQSRNAPWW